MGPFFDRDREPSLKGSFIRGSDSGAHNGRVNTVRALLLLCAALATWPGAWAGERDHERARAAVAAGQILPLPALLERLQRTHPGQVLELELERHDGRWIYEVKLLQTNAQLVKLELDAGTGQLLQVRRDRRPEPSKESPR